jgi:hypothetical protein
MMVWQNPQSLAGFWEPYYQYLPNPGIPTALRGTPKAESGQGYPPYH